MVAAKVDDQAEEYRRGREEGLVWAYEFATSDELRNLVEDSYKPDRIGDVDPHRRGFVAGAEEALDDAGSV